MTDDYSVERNKIYCKMFFTLQVMTDYTTNIGGLRVNKVTMPARA